MAIFNSFLYVYQRVMAIYLASPWLMVLWETSSSYMGHDDLGPIWGHSQIQSLLGEVFTNADCGVKKALQAFSYAPCISLYIHVWYIH